MPLTKSAMHFSESDWQWRGRPSRSPEPGSQMGTQHQWHRIADFLYSYGVCRHFFALNILFVRLACEDQLHYCTFLMTFRLPS